MKTILRLAMAGLITCTGCTTLTLQEYTSLQTKSGGDGRDDLVLSALATVAADPDALPPFALYINGITTVTDSVILNDITTWTPLKYVLKTLGFTASTSPKGQWTVDPSAEYQQLEAIHAACLWALFGPERACRAYPTGILGDSNHYLDGKPHFGVEDRLAKTRPGWIHFGGLAEMPLRARFKGHKGNTWVWVMPQGSESFAQFTLVLHDIATLDPPLFAAPPILVVLTTYEVTNLPDLTNLETDKKKNVSIGTTETRAVKKEYKEIIEKAIQSGIMTEDGKTGKVKLTRAQWMEYTEPWHGMRNAVGTSPITPTAASSALPIHPPPNVLVLPSMTGPSFTAPPR